ncbi:fimbria/pilus periplasmic chaperone [Enterobacteriaceae bacterium LUAb1]
MIKKFLFLVIFFFTGAFPVFSSMTIYGTRIIFLASNKEVVVRTANKGASPALVQVWIDDGKANSNLNKVKTPFIVTPPVYRVEPGKGQSIRIIYNGITLPQDKESVFWFNMLEIPKKSKTASEQRLDLAFRTQIKIFYRPTSISKSDMDHQKDKLKWNVVDDPQGVGIKVSNVTPYYLSLDSANIVSRGKKVELLTKMVAPHTETVFYPKNKISKNDGVNELEYRYINDYGAVISQKMILSKDKGTFIQKTIKS